MTQNWHRKRIIIYLFNSISALLQRILAGLRGLLRLCGAIFSPLFSAASFFGRTIWTMMSPFIFAFNCIISIFVTLGRALFGSQAVVNAATSAATAAAAASNAAGTAAAVGSGSSSPGGLLMWAWNTAQWTLRIFQRVVLGGVARLVVWVLPV